MIATPYQRRLDLSRGATPQDRIVSAEVDLDTFEKRVDSLEQKVDTIGDDVKWVKRLLVGSFASTTFAALMLVAQGVVR